MSNEEIRRAILEMDEREELAKDMLEQVWSTRHEGNAMQGRVIHSDHIYPTATNVLIGIDYNLYVISRIQRSILVVN